MRGKMLQALIVVSAISGLVWMGGLAWAMKDYFSGGDPVVLTSPQPSATTPPAQRVQAAPATSPGANDQAYRVVGLGDSLTRGFGDPEGQGYGGKLANLLREGGQEVVYDNLGVNGQTAPQLVSLLQQQDVQAKVKTARLLLVSIGGNDLFRGGETLSNLESTRTASLQTEYNKQLKTILTRLRELNPNATITLIGLYNPFIELQNSAVTSKIVRDWNYAAGETLAAFPKTMLVPTFDLFQFQSKDVLYIDQFHPNANGYELMAERIEAALGEQGGA